ncbi:ExbD/TolR family protein [Sessilibacter corallicola]|uniref:Biopolymer transporter ExbD n=1 Tax=Sessilibacter corallicola TaxID=2904075 RepID=A0ABQ0AB41_9GAMM|nr:biopolymer transporter ExbD [Sessilibacter corallicola]MCE2028258.1 biopolymer transporter ExbD [Sessilibacter corallicola]
MSRRRRRGDAEDKADIDLTPMLDVVFIMLIFFIVTASFIKEVGLNINIPDLPDEPPPVDPDGPKNILVEVTSANEIMMEGRRVDIRSVRSVIERQFAENPEAVVIVKADAKSEAGTYVAIADAAKSAKVPQVTLVPDGIDN